MSDPNKRTANKSIGKSIRILRHQHGWSQETQARLQQFLATHKDEILQRGKDAAAHAASILSNVGWIVLIPILAFFFLKDKRTFGSAALGAFDARRQRSFLRGVMNDLDSMLATYIRAQLLLSLFAAVAYTAFLLIMRFPYAFALGPIGGLLEFIPKFLNITVSRIKYRISD